MCAEDMYTISKIDEDEDVSDLSRYHHPEGGAMYKYDVKDVSGSQYVVLYNSMKDVEFSIDSVTLEHGLYANSSSQTYNATNEKGVSLRMEVVEPYTADFIGVLEVAASNLGLSNVSQLSYGLKILFVGYPDDHNTSHPHIVCDVNILPFMITEITMALNNRGCHYDIECTPTMDNAAKHHGISKIGGMSTTLPESLPSAVTKFEKDLNDRSKQSQDTNPESKPYKYKIVLDPAYNDPKYNLDIVADDQRNVFNGSQPLTKNNTPDGKPKNFTDQTVQSTNKPDTQTPQSTQSQKDSSGVVQNSQYDMPTINYGEEKLRVMDQPNYQVYKDYRDNLFNHFLTQGQDPDTALSNAKIDAAAKYDKVIAEAIAKSKQTQK